MCLAKATIKGLSEPKGEEILLPTVDDGYTEAEIEQMKIDREERVKSGVNRVGDDPDFLKKRR